MTQQGWSGNPEPAPAAKRDLAFTTAHQWMFDRKIPASSEARKALALYREGRNAEQNFLVSYAVLSYYKIIELKYPQGPETRRWIANNYGPLAQTQPVPFEIVAFEKERGNEEPHVYIGKAYRVATAHASAKHPSDPDEAQELRRLYVGARVLRMLARCFIKQELGVSDSPYDGS